MRLKEIRLKGFKSFANDTRIGFEEQVVGIVGPNGAGKSNIVDAMRWVLGEQKGKDLRTEKQIDVIFNGTAAKKKSSLAEVSMVFDNTKNIIPTEYKQVEISRLLYRSGDSEYQLNGTKCRRKDIINLFLDTGIGSNSYAIIQLGMVDDILFDKDNARHKMFEQAAGISKFKKRKRETLLKLKSTQTDLERIKDILHELESNMKSLEKQAKRAKRYYEIKDKYKELSINLSATSFNVKTAEYAELKKEITTKEDIYRSEKNTVLELEAKLENSRTDNLTKEQTLSQSQKEFNSLTDNLRTKENEKQINQKELEFNKNTIDKLRQTVKNLQVEIDQVKNDLGPLQTQREENIAAVKKEEELFQIAEQKYTEIKTLLQSLQGDSNEQVAILNKYEEQVFDFEKKLVVTENDISRTQNLIENFIVQLTQSTSSENELKKNLDEVKEKETKILSEIEVHQEQQSKYKEELKSIEADLESNISNFNELNRKLDSKQNEHDLIKSMIDNLEGFPASTKFLVEKWKKTPILSNIIDAKKEYKAGLEVYLQSYLNHFIVENHGEAFEAINMLNGAQKGKAQFFILNQIETSKNKVSCPIPDAILATEILDIEPQYQDLLHELLKGVFFIDEWKDEYLIDLPADCTLIDRSGKYCINRSQLSGGSVGLFEGKKIGRENTLKKLSKEITKLTQQASELNASIEKSRASKINVAEKIEDNPNDDPLLGELERLRAQIVQIDTQLSNKVDLAQNLQGQIALNKDHILNFTQSLKEITTQRDSAKEELEKYKQVRDKATGEIDKILEDSQVLTEEYNQANISLIKTQNMLESLVQDIRFKEERQEKITTEFNQAQEEIQGLNESIAEGEKSAERLEQELKVLYNQKEEMSKELSETEQNYFSERSSINELESNAQKARRSLNDKQIEINEKKSLLQNIQFELTGIKERLSIEFQIEKEDLQTLLESAKDLNIEEGMEEEVFKLRRRLENYGEINPMAVDAFDEVKERFDLISGQRDDILEAESSLLETIQEIESSASEMFLSAFNKVNTNFGEVFRSLFTEDDKAEIILTDPENPLESNIEIIARPKGKRPSTLKQLSGGERTLTATALLFSLYLLKPAPFCIFDEVDAPLDDSNIQKFVKLIKEFSKDSQFVIITHNKSTMAAVDTLYGVFMQEKGVSGVAQVDFRKYEHEEIFQTANVN